MAYALVDLGTHPNPVYGGEQHKVLISWELPDCRGDFEKDGQKVNMPRVASKRYTLSLSEKADLRKDLESWRGRKFTAAELAGFDLKAVLGTPCQLQIIEKTAKDGRKISVVGAVMALPKGMTRPKQTETPLAFFSFEEAGEKPELPQGLPEWVSKIVMASREWKESRTGTPAPASATPSPDPAAPDGGAAGEEDNIPF